MKSDVYFVNLDTSSPEGRVAALKKLLAGIGPFLKYEKDEILPLKLTIGDSPCVYNMNPELVRLVVSDVKKRGARPFLFDTSVIYSGQRQNAVDHLSLAQTKGFGHSKTGAPFIIADGLFGQDGREFSIGAKEIDKIKIPSFVGMLDSLLVLSHTTGHIVSRYAGAIKNVAMGISCRATKQVQHSSLKPSIITEKCTGCLLCVKACPVKAISSFGKKSRVDQKLCIGCGECICACRFDAVFINWDEDPHVFCARMVDVARFILSKFSNPFFITFAFDITKECDCISAKGEAMVSKDIGILASRDILSLDRATVDLVKKNKKTDYFDKETDIYEGMLEYAAARGLGNPAYNLITL